MPGRAKTWAHAAGSAASAGACRGYGGPELCSAALQHKSTREGLASPSLGAGCPRLGEEMELHHPGKPCSRQGPARAGGKQQGRGDFWSENGFVQRCVSGPRLLWVHPPLPGSSALLPPPGEGWLCSQLVLTFRLNTEVGDPAVQLGVTAGKPRKSKPQLPDLSKLKPQEENRHEVTPRTHASVAWSQQSAARRPGPRGAP